MAKEATDSSGPPTDRLTEPRAPKRRCRDVKTARGLEICEKSAGEVPARIGNNLHWARLNRCQKAHSDKIPMCGQPTAPKCCKCLFWHRNCFCGLEWLTKRSYMDFLVLPRFSPVLPGSSPGLPGSSPVLPGSSPVLPGSSPVLPGSPRFSRGIPPAVRPQSPQRALKSFGGLGKTCFEVKRSGKTITVPQSRIPTQICRNLNYSRALEKVDRLCASGAQDAAAAA